MKKGVVLGLFLFGILFVSLSLGFVSAGCNHHCSTIWGAGVVDNHNPSLCHADYIGNTCTTTYCYGSQTISCVDHSNDWFYCVVPGNPLNCGYVAPPPPCTPFWTNCSVTCGGGTQTDGCGHTRVCNTQACCVPAVEICDNIDNNCNDVVDEGCSLVVNINSPLNQNYNNYTQLVNLTTQGIWPSIWFNWDGIDVPYISPVLVDFYEGENTLIAYVNDSLGNINSTSVTFLIDTSAPLVTIESPADNELSLDSNLPINYIVSDMNIGSCWWILDGGLETSISCEDNITTETWSEGVHSVTVYSNDTSGNTGFATVNFEIDSVAPIIIILNPTSGGIFGAEVLIRTTITDVNLDDTSLIYEIVENGVVNSSGILNFDGTNYIASFLTDSSWPNMDLTLVVYANDTLGNSATASVDFILDNTVPSITFINPAGDNSSIFNSNFNLNVVLNGYQLSETSFLIKDNLGMDIVSNIIPLSQDSYTLNDLIDISSMADGIYNLIIDVADSSDPVDTLSATTYFTIDTTLPTLTINSPAGDYNTNIITFDVTVDEQATECNYSIDGGEAVVMTSVDGFNFVDTNSSMGEGLHDVSFICWDNAGNSNTASSSFFIDSIPVLITIIAPENKTYNAVDFVTPMYFEATINKPVDSCTFLPSQGALVPYAMDMVDSTHFISQSIYLLSIFANTFDGGNSYFGSMAFDCVDSIGTSGTSVVEYSGDTVIPTLTILSLPDFIYNTANVTFSLSLDEPGVCYYSLNDGVNITMDDIGGNSFESLITGLGQGNQTILFSCEDYAGNWVFGETNFSVDTIPPMIIALEPYDGQIFNSSEIFLNITGDGTEQAIWFDDGISTIIYTGAQYYNFSEGLNNITIYLNDSIGNVYIYNLVFTVLSENTIVNSWIYGIYYLLNTTSEVTSTTVTNSAVNDSTIEGVPVSSVLYSNIYNSNLTDVAVIDHCTVLNSELTGGICSYTTIDPSDITADDTTGSIITNSFVYYYSVTWSNETNCINWYSVVNNSVIVNTNKSYANIFDSNIQDSVITNSTITSSTILNSIITLSTVTGSVVIDSYVYNSDLTDSTITNSIIEDSTIINSIVVDSTILNSVLTDSNVLNSTVTDSIITNSTMIDSYVFNANITDSSITNSSIIDAIVINSDITNTNITSGVITDANITDNVVYWGNITFNGTSTIVIPGSPINLTELINYPPVAILNVAAISYVDDFVIFYGSSSYDVNVGTLLNDSLTYEFAFGDGINSAGISDTASRAYSAVGSYNVSLTVTDKYGASDTDNQIITIIAKPSAPSGGGGGSGSCITEWECGLWSNCLNYNQTRSCVKVKSYCYAGARPIEIRSCTPDNPIINNAEIIFPSVAEVEKFQEELLKQAKQSMLVWFLVTLLLVILGIIALIVYLLRRRVITPILRKVPKQIIQQPSVVSKVVRPIMPYQPKVERLPIKTTKKVDNKKKKKNIRK